jgi:hypothetical protein
MVEDERLDVQISSSFFVPGPLPGQGRRLAWDTGKAVGEADLPPQHRFI